MVRFGASVDGEPVLSTLVYISVQNKAAHCAFRAATSISQLHNSSSTQCALDQLFVTNVLFHIGASLYFFVLCRSGSEACEVFKDLERARGSGCPKTLKVSEGLVMQGPRRFPGIRRSEDLESVQACEANRRKILRPAGCSSEARPARLLCGRSVQ